MSLPSFRTGRRVALLLAACLAAQTAAAADADAILGFENAAAWSAGKGVVVASSTTRTQGAAALAIANPPNLLKLDSAPIASTAAALAGIGEIGALLQVDLGVPLQQGNAHNAGWIRATLSVPSRNLRKIDLDKISLDGFRPGTYNTLSFALPDKLRTALAGASYADLSVEFTVSSPGQVTGAYLFDNLRVHSIGSEQSPTAPPPGYGGSVDLVVIGGTPSTQNFDVGPLQIPKSFHLKKGTVDGSTVELGIGLDGALSTHCVYVADINDATHRDYVLHSCAEGAQAGDLVAANTVRLNIAGGDAGQKLRAQLVMRPMGDVLGTDLLPPMPTFWGDADTCVPEPAEDSVVTVSVSCMAQTVAADQILTDYFNEVNQFNPNGNWIVTPVPEHALRHDDGRPFDLLNGPPPTPLDPPFDATGHLNQGGNFDAYWRLNGNLTPNPIAGTDQNKTHFDAAFSTHGVLYGHDIDVVDIRVVADTDSGQTAPHYVPATSSGSIAFYVFGQQVPGGNRSVDLSASFSVDPKWSHDYDLPSLRIWIFDITLGATAVAELKAMGSASLGGADLVITPSAAIGAHMRGGINLGIASGGVDARVDLINAATPIQAQAKWVIDTQPSVCAARLDGRVKTDLQLSSGGGKVDLVATFGVCPFCDHESHTLFKWAPLASTSYSILDASINTQLFGLPASLCVMPPLTLSIDRPGANEVVRPGQNYNPIGTLHSSDPFINSYPTTWQWKFTPANGADSFTFVGSADSADPFVVFAPPAVGSSAAWTAELTATVTTTGATPITATVAAPPVTFTVADHDGVFIDYIGSDQGQARANAQGVYQLGNLIKSFTVAGSVIGASGALNTVFTLTHCMSPTCTVLDTSQRYVLIPSDPSSTTPTATLHNGLDGTYLLEMTTTDGGAAYGTAKALVIAYNLL